MKGRMGRGAENLPSKNPALLGLTKDSSWTIHENNMHTLLIEICKSLNHISPPIIQEFFDLKVIVFQITFYRHYLKQILQDMVRQHYVLKEV